MDETVTFQPGTGDTAVTWSGSSSTSGSWSSSIDHFTGCLENDSSGFIVDTSGNRIILNGGFDTGDLDNSSTWMPGDMV